MFQRIDVNTELSYIVYNVILLDSMMPQNVISLRVAEVTKDRLDRLVRSTKRSRSFLAAEALDEYLERHQWQVDAIDEAVIEADKGTFVSHNAVTNWLESWGSEDELLAPEADIQKPRK